MNIKNGWRCTHHMHKTLLSVEKTLKACKTVCIKVLIIQLLFQRVTLTQLHLYLQGIRGSFSSSLLYPPDNNLSIPQPLTFSHTFECCHPNPVAPPHQTITQGPQPKCLPLVCIAPRLKQLGHLIGLGRKMSGKALLLFMFPPKYEYPVSPILPACCIRQKIWLNSHFRCAGAFSTLQIAYQRDRAGRIESTIDTQKSSTVKVDF